MTILRSEGTRMKVLLIVPAYNEQESIASVAKTIEDAGYDYIVVSDGSTDATEQICRKNHINLLSLSKNLGIGGAVQAGHRYAREHDYDVDIQFDGDGQHDIAYVPALLAEIEKGADLVIGSRFIGNVGNAFTSTALRRLGIGWLNRMIKMVCGVTVTDATSGFRASGKRAIKMFARRYPSDYPEPESIVSAAKKGLEIREAPVVMHERQGGVSSITPLASVYYMIKVTLAILIASITKTH
ncbi:glycosyltransferase family 2 protein [Olegusella massiliensis]|uniref:glycosyltransferase family 2 protein n=1 Tax=Olegusella massiliensis TaxID=1776381 RepID=UPI0040555599